MTVLALLIAVPRVYVNRRRLLIADCQSFPSICLVSTLTLGLDCTVLALVFSIAYLVIISLSKRPRKASFREHLTDEVRSRPLLPT